ncbi:MAG: N4-gp56 family major capsid protein, partial [Oscillospiraceae bacterium]
MTKIENIINPQVMADMINENLESQMKFSSLCKIDKVLNGRAGDKVTLPKYAYIGDAIDVGEGQAIPVETLTATTEQVNVKKAGKGIELTDEAVLSGYGDPMGESAFQLSLSIANKVDNDVLDCLAKIKTNMTIGDGSKKLDSDFIADALVKFGEDIYGDKVLIIAAEQ